MRAAPIMFWATGVSSDIVRHARNVAFLLGRGAREEVWKAVRERLSSRIEYVMLVRDLALPFPTPAARIPLHLRAFRPGDEVALLEVSSPSMAPADLRARLSRRRLLEEGIGSPYVVVTENGEPCYLQWLFRPEDNGALHAFTGEFFPDLAPDEALLEGAFTVEHARAKGVMAWAQAEIGLRAGLDGAHRAIMFVTADNVASLKGSERAGFVRKGGQSERWFLFRRTIERPPLDQKSSATGGLKC